MATSTFLDQGFSNQGVSLAGSKTIVGDRESIAFGRVTGIPATSSVSSVALTLIPSLPTLPSVSQASAQVTAAALPAVTLASVAQVRAAQGAATSASSALVIDFQAQRTVSAVAGPVAITAVAPWLGTKFDGSLTTLVGSGGTTVTFPELQTERLLVTLGAAADPAVFAAQGSVVIPTPPSNLELLVGDTRVWFNAGPAVGSGSGGFSAEIDISAGVKAAVAAGQLPVVLTLRSAAPGTLTLAGTADLLRRYQVAFPEGSSRTVDAPTEGVYPLSLPISSASIGSSDPRPDEWQIRAVVLELRAKISQTRVLPPDGPAISTDAELVVDPDHAFVVRLPAVGIGLLAVLSGVRLAVSAGADGAELAGTLRSGSMDAPGDPIPKGGLGPVTLQPPASASSSPAWIDLTLATPHQLADGEVVWLELQAARGSLIWALAEPQANALDDAPVRRRTASGSYVALSKIADIPSYSGALRVVGQGRPNEPLPALVAAVAGDTANTPVAGVPTPDGTTMILSLPVAAARVAPAGGSDSELRLALTISTPGSYAIAAAELQYKPATSEG